MNKLTWKKGDKHAILEKETRQIIYINKETGKQETIMEIIDIEDIPKKKRKKQP